MFRFCRMTVVVTLIACMLVQFSLPAVASSDEYDMLRNRLKSTMTGGDMIDTSDPDIMGRTTTISTRAQNFWDSMNKDSERTHLWSDYTSTTVSSHITSTYTNIRSIAIAYETPGTTLYKNMELKQDLLEALDWMHVHRYNEEVTQYDNWWDWEVGVPQVLNEIVVLLYDELSEEQITDNMNTIHRFTPVPYGAPTRVSNTAYIVAIRGIIIKDGSQITLARDSFHESGMFEYVTQGDGFYEDGSNIAHKGHPYNGGYGLTLLNNVANYVYLLNDSSWEFDEAVVSNVFEWAYEAFEPFVYNGSFMDMVRGREIARSYAQSHNTGNRTISTFIRLAQIAPEADALKYKQMVKEWISKNTFSNYFATASLEMITLGKKIIDDQSIPPRGPLVKHKQYPNMDRIVHLQQNYGFGLSMHSNRTYNYESINHENLKGWHMGDGATYLYSSDLAQYNDDYWAAVNFKRLPGTTVDSSPRANGSGQSSYTSQSWVGGASTGGLYGAAGMDLEGSDVNSNGNRLKAKKSWFMFDDEIVALGAGISDTDGGTIETIIDNRKINAVGNNELTVNGIKKSTELDWNETMNAANWIHLEGNAPGSDISYYFPEGGAEVKGLREARTGRWSDINGRGGLTNDIERNFVTLWFDHGVNPQGENYSYVILPDKDAPQTSAYNENPDIQVLYNTEEIQAVRETDLGLLAANFWMPGQVEYMKASQPASVIVKEGTDTLDVSISDPTHTQEQIIVELSKVSTGVISQDPSITVLQTAPVKLAVNTAGTQGRTHSIKISYDPAQMDPVKKLHPVADAYVDSGHPDVNHGTSQQMVVDHSREAFLKFELPNPNGVLDEAKLYVHASMIEPGEGSVTSSVYAALDNDWIEAGEGSITWNNKPPTGLKLGEFSVNENAEWISVDVTDYIRTHLNEGHIAGFTIKQAGVIHSAVAISSKEGASEFQPYLAIKSYTFHGADLDKIHALLNGSDVLKIGTEASLTIEGLMDDGSPADLSVASITYSSSMPEVAAVDGAGTIAALKTGRTVITVTVSLDGTVRSAMVPVIVTNNGIEKMEFIAIADSYVESGYPDKNNGSNQSIIVTNNGSNRREAYFKFNIAQLQDQAQVRSAKLKFWATNSDAKGGTKEHQVLLAGNNWDEATITWNNKPVPGSVVASVNIDPGWKWYEVDVTDAIKAQLELEQTLSFHVKQDDEARYVTIFSSEKTSEQPRLVLETYSLEDGGEEPPAR